MQRNYKPASKESAFTSSKDLSGSPLSAEASLSKVMETREIKDAPGYLVTTEGNVISSHYYGGKKAKVMKLDTSTTGYYRVCLVVNKRKKNFSVHRMVADAFIPNPDNLPQVNHKDLNKKNNYVENLEWVTCSENIRHGIRNGARLHYKPAVGAKNARSKLTDDKVREIRQLYKIGIPISNISRFYHLSYKPIQDVVLNKTWKQLL